MFVEYAYIHIRVGGESGYPKNWIIFDPWYRCKSQITSCHVTTKIFVLATKSLSFGEFLYFFFFCDPLMKIVLFQRSFDKMCRFFLDPLLEKFTWFFRSFGKINLCFFYNFFFFFEKFIFFCNFLKKK